MLEQYMKERLESNAEYDNANDHLQKRRIVLQYMYAKLSEPQKLATMVDRYDGKNITSDDKQRVKELQKLAEENNQDPTMLVKLKTLVHDLVAPNLKPSKSTKRKRGDNVATDFQESPSVADSSAPKKK